MVPGVTFLSTCRLDMGNPLATPSVAQCHLLGVLDKLALARNLSILVTCVAEGHGPADPHTQRMAMDIRTSDVSELAAGALANSLSLELGTKWTVLYEAAPPPSDPTLARFYYADPNSTGPHLHVQPIRGTLYP